MSHFTTAAFGGNCYERLPVEVQRIADRNFELLKSDASHPSPHFKQVGQFRSARVGMHYRALTIEKDDGDLIWFWIGSHADYDGLLS